MEKKHTKWIAIGIVVVLILAALFTSIKIVPTNYTGVRETFGQISEEPLEAGLNWTLPFGIQKVHLISNKQQNIVFSSEVWGESIEKTPVYATGITVAYKVTQERSVWVFKNVEDTENLVTTDLVSSAIKSAMIEYTAAEVTDRNKIQVTAKDKLNEKLTAKYGEGTVEVVDVIINNMDFEDSYNQAIAAKSTAQQAYEQQKIDNQKAIEKAEADAQVKRTQAEADAEVIRIKAEAQAEANRLINESLSGNLNEYKMIEKWNGELPKVSGSNGTIVDFSEITQASE